MKQKLEALLSNNRSRTILTVVIVAVIVTVSIGIGSTLASGNESVEALTISEKAAKEIAFNKTDGGILESFKMDYDDGKKVYEIEIIKGDYEYDIKIDAGTGEIIAYDQEKTKVAAATTKSAVTKTDDSNTAGTSSSGSGSSNTSANSGSSSSSQNSSSGSNTESSNGYIGKAKAKSIALNKVGGGTVAYCHLDYDDGRAEYEIKIYYGKYEYEMEIDAKTGKIRDFEKELQDKYEHDDDDYDDHHDHDDHHDD